MARNEVDRLLMAEAFEVARDYVGPEDQPLKLAKLAERIAEVARRHAARVASSPRTDGETT